MSQIVFQKRKVPSPGFVTPNQDEISRRYPVLPRDKAQGFPKTTTGTVSNDGITDFLGNRETNAGLSRVV